MQLFMTLLVLGIWLWIGAYGYRASKKKNLKLVTGSWAFLTLIVAAYIISTLFL